jgi:serine protease AprX
MADESARSETGPKGSKKRPHKKKKQYVDTRIGDAFSRATVPRQLENPEQREEWGLPDNDDDIGPYIVELNLQHVDGLTGAANVFVQLYDKLIIERQRDKSKAHRADVVDSAAVRIGKTYYSCSLSVKEWRKLVMEDERKADEQAAAVAWKPPSPTAVVSAISPARYRCIYRIWPDFPVKAHIDRSVSTVKGDAALKAFDAGGDGIVWAVIDSGVKADHPHFGDAVAARAGDPTAKARHLLLDDGVVGLHRCLCAITTQKNGVDIVRTLGDPDIDPDPFPYTVPGPGADASTIAASHEARQKAVDARQKALELRPQLLKEHQEAALADGFGHGTHVAGIVAGGTGVRPESVAVRVYERQFKTDAEGNKASQSYGIREFSSPERLRAVAPRCKLISLRVLDDKGEGRASDVMRALEYIRERLNDDPKVLRVHGVNLSVGYEFDPEMFACGQSPLCTEVDRLVQAGVVVVTAAGNTGYGTVAAQQRASKAGLSNTINDPGNAELAITVGSTHRDAPHTYGVSYFSSKGPTGDGRLKPDLVAPGERITSCAAGKMLADAVRDTSGLQTAATNDEASYVDDTGTSMAAPHVSGAIAAFLSIRREFIGKPLEVKRIFLESATPMGRERYFEGHGLVDLMRAIQSV